MWTIACEMTWLLSLSIMILKERIVYVDQCCTVQSDPVKQYNI